VRFTKAGVAALALPEGKSDAIFFDEALPGFGLRLRAGGRKTWIVQYRTGHQQRRETLGDLRKLDLDQARRAAKRRLGAVALGHDPALERTEARARARHTVGAVVPRFLERKRSMVRPSSFAAIELHLLKRWATLHDRPVHEIARREVASRLAEIQAEFGPNSARTARTVLGEFFGWCMGEGLVDANPIIGTNEPPAPKSRERVLDDAELAAIWRACDSLGEYGMIVNLLMLTGCRRDEIADMRWHEIDLDRGMLRIPGERTKNGRELALTLPPFALSILEGLPFCRLGHDRRVFGRGEGGYAAWSQGKAALDARMADKPLQPWVLHDLRRTAATRMAELGVQPHVIEAVLNHVSGHKAGVAGVYNRASYEREIKSALAIWANHVRAVVDGSAAKVVPLRAG
jgi:integrase